MKKITEFLTEAERQTFATLEATIAASEEAAMAYVDCLTQIRVQRLYREKYQTWDNYCQTKWGKSCRAITFAIDANKIRKELINGDPSIRKRASEISNRTALALKNVKPVSRKSVFRKASKIASGKPVSPSHIAQASSRQQVTIENLASTGVYFSAPKEQRAAPPAPPELVRAPQPAPKPPTAATQQRPQKSRDQRLLELLHQIEQHCPCGARPESTNTHPHVISCPVELAILLLETE